MSFAPPFPSLRGRAKIWLALALTLAATLQPALAQAPSDPLRLWLTNGKGLPPTLAESSWRGVWNRLYAGRQHAPCWFDGGQPGERFAQLAAALDGLADHGITLQKRGQELLDEVRGNAGQSLSAERVAELELRLTEQLLNAAALLQQGRTDPSKMDPQWHLEVPPFDPQPIIAGLETNEPVQQLLARMAPQTADYQRLRQALADYRLRLADGEWGTVPDGPSLRPGEESEVVVPLRERLVNGGDMTPALPMENPDLYDPELEAAVKRFQERHGLDPDGVIGKRTRTALNVTRAGRIAHLRAALERWRWLPDDAGSHLLVNTAAFRLSLHRPGEEPLEMRVIVGKADKKWSTPSFDSKIRQVELNPFWNIPDSILREEILEATREDPGYLERKKIRAIGADGEKLEITADQLHQDIASGSVDYRLRQDSGAGNALGRIKLVLPNRFGIYLHDTPRHSLFSRTYRAMSHGCVRLERPYDLAAALLGGEWNAAKLEQTALGGGRRTLTLRPPMTIRIAYITAWVEPDGTVQFREDYYNRDGRLLAAFAE